MAGPVATAVTWATYGTNLKAYMYVSSSSHDDVLQQLLAAGCQFADTFLRNPFTELRVRITVDGPEAGDAVKVNGAVFTFETVDDDTEREVALGEDDDETAENLVAMINSEILGGSYGAVGVEGVIASAADNVVTIAHRYPNEAAITADSTSETRLRVDVIRAALTVPTDVVMWVFQFVAWKFGNRDGRKSERGALGVESVTWGDQPDTALLDRYAMGMVEIV